MVSYAALPYVCFHEQCYLSMRPKPLQENVAINASKRSLTYTCSKYYNCVREQSIVIVNTWRGEQKWVIPREIEQKIAFSCLTPIDFAENWHIYRQSTMTIWHYDTIYNLQAHYDKSMHTHFWPHLTSWVSFGDHQRSRFFTCITTFECLQFFFQCIWRPKRLLK